MLEGMSAERNCTWPECPYVFARYGKKLLDFRGAWLEASRRAAAVCPSLWNEEANRL
jgi:hypothetical protein